MRNNKGRFVPGKKPVWFEKKRVGAMVGHIVSEETKKKIGEKNKISLLGNTPWNKGKKGLQVAWNKGLKLGNKIRYQLIKSKNYRKLHIWVEDTRGKPQLCQHCGNQVNLDWCSIDGKYIKDPLEWISLCRSCHLRYDRMTI